MKIKNIYLLLLLASFWGPSFLFIKIAVEEIPPVMLAALRIGTGALVLNLILLFSKYRLPRDFSLWKKIFIAGFFAQGLPFILMNWGEQYVDSSLASVLNGLVPIFTILLAHNMVADERLNPQKVRGVLLGFLGLIILILPSLFDGVQGSLGGIIGITIAALSYSIGFVYIRKHLLNLPAFTAPAAQLLSVSVYLVPISFIVYPNFDLTAIGSSALISTLILGVIGTAIAFVVYFKLIEQSSAGYASLVTYIMPVFGVVLGVAFLDEPLTPWILLGAAFILLGIKVTKQRKAAAKLPKVKFKIDPALYTKFR
ncbi:MAG: DMT family transporter [Ekhidna sp.]